MTEIEYRGKKHRAPSSWEECRSDHIVQLIPFSRVPAQQLTEDIRILACQLWLRVHPKTWARWRLDHTQWEALKGQFAWIFTPPTDRPFRYFEHRGTRYVLPEENFGNCTALEVCMAFVEYASFAHPEEPDATALDRLIATLCRPVRRDLKAYRLSADWNDDEREPYNEARSLARATGLASLPLEWKVAVLTYFEQTAQGFLHQYGQMFGGDAEPRYGDGRGWIMLLKNIAKEGHFGSFDTVCRQPVHLVFAAALDDTITAEEIRQKQDSDAE
jgi:hypothetical protein